MDNAAGVKIGTPVMLAGRRVGRVTQIDSPVPVAERPTAEDGTRLKTEARLKVRVDRAAQIYKTNKVQLANYTLLTEPVFDFIEGDEASGLAPEGTKYIGGRSGSLADAGTQLLEKVDPALKQLSATLKSLQRTANNLTHITDEGSDLSMTFTETRKIAANLGEVTGPEGSLRRALDGFERLTGNDGEVARTLAEFRRLLAPDGDLSKAIAHLEQVTGEVSHNKDIPVALKNLRIATDRMNSTISTLDAYFEKIGGNLTQASDTLKHQPWRLIWPGTKKYPEDKIAKPKPAPTRTPTPVSRRKK
jgi:ABC-type transporter Mla subunit MlaD